MPRSTLNFQYLSFFILAGIVLMSLLSGVIASDQPLLVGTAEGIAWANNQMEEDEIETVYLPFIPYGTDLQPLDAYTPPFQQGSAHLLGTDQVGRDVLALIVHGGAFSLKLSFFGIALATFLGAMLGGLAGFFGDHQLQLNKGQLTIGTLLLLILIFYINQAIWLDLSGVVANLMMALALSIVLLLIGYLLNKFSVVRQWSRQGLTIPLDLITVKVIEVFNSIPWIFIMLTFVVLFEASMNMFVVLIGLTAWTTTARLVRGEMIKIRRLDYIKAAQLSGLTPWRTFWSHALPNAINPIWVSFTFGMAAVIVMESTLSFLGVEMPLDTVSWGGILSDFRQKIDAWWLALFPGLIIFITILSLHGTGQLLQSRLNPRR